MAGSKIEDKKISQKPDVQATQKESKPASMQEGDAIFIGFSVFKVVKGVLTAVGLIKAPGSED